MKRQKSDNCGKEEGTKRHRSCNFTKLEENLLINLVKRFEKAIECKKTDNVHNSKKQEAWNNVVKLFNSQTKVEVYRDVEALKGKYANMKKRMMKNHSEEKSAGKTDEGPLLKIQTPDETEDAQLIETVGNNEWVNGRASEFVDINFQDRLAGWAQGKSELVELPRESIAKEQEVKLELFRKREERLLALQEEEIKLRMDLLREKHQEEIRILKLKYKLMEAGKINF